jgi:uncharacterized membrane protein YbaN (DUF454 family)
MTRGFVRVSRVLLGCFCLLLGVVGLFLPFLQGVLFLIIGLSLLSTESERARRLLDFLRGLVRRRKQLREEGDGSR